MRRIIVLAAFAAIAGVLLAPAGAGASDPDLTDTVPNLTVAFLGDSATGSDFRAVLQLIEDEGADMAIHLGDMGYGNETDPQTAITWDGDVSAILGADYPYFGAIGNHDVGNWSTYQSVLLDRLALVPGASCSGNYGVDSACTYQGLFFILSGIGTFPNTPDYGPHVDYLADTLAADDHLWRICGWHKNQQAMQVGEKTNEVGWDAYETCRHGRAIIATAHEHSYHRTKVLSNTQSQTVDPAWTDSGDLRVSPGSTFVFVSGLGGNNVRNQDRCLPITLPYGCNGEWASIYTSNQSAKDGALFIEFNVDGNPRKANGYFKNIDGVVIDSFTVMADPSKTVGGLTEPTTPATSPSSAPDDPSSNAIPIIAIGAGVLAIVFAAAYLIRREGPGSDA